MLTSQIKALAERYHDHCGTLDARYKILHKLGEGRYGKVYLALDLSSSALVAVKILRAACFRHQLTNFFNEIRHLIFLLDCIGCEKELRATRILDFSFEGRLSDGRAVAYYVMEYVALGEFYSLIEKSGFVSEDLACHFLRQLVATTKLLHAHALYHLDIKPENVLVSERGELYLCDFGNALYCRRVKEVHWRKVSFVGSWEYAAPEAHELDAVKEMKAAHKRVGDYELGKLDSFSLGVLAFVTVVKSRPFGKAHDDDPYYKRFLASKASFWAVFEGLRCVSKEFKAMVESMLEPANSERAGLDQLNMREWLGRELCHSDIEQELRILLEQRKQQFLKELVASLESKATKRKQTMSNSKLQRYKDGEDVLRRFLHKNEKKLMQLRYEMGNCHKSTGRHSPIEVSSVSGNSSDDDYA